MVLELSLLCRDLLLERAELLALRTSPRSGFAGGASAREGLAPGARPHAAVRMWPGLSHQETLPLSLVAPLRPSVRFRVWLGLRHGAATELTDGTVYPSLSSVLCLLIRTPSPLGQRESVRCDPAALDAFSLLEDVEGTSYPCLAQAWNQPFLLGLPPRVSRHRDGGGDQPLLPAWLRPGAWSCGHGVFPPHDPEIVRPGTLCGSAGGRSAIGRGASATSEGSCFRQPPWKVRRNNVPFNSAFYLAQCMQRHPSEWPVWVTSPCSTVFFPTETSASGMFMAISVWRPHFHWAHLIWCGFRKTYS